MKIVIAGGTGFVGNALIQLLQHNGHDIFVLTRHKSKLENGVHYVQWLHQHEQALEIFEGVDAFVNLAGVSLNNGRWTKKAKESYLLEQNECHIRDYTYNGHAHDKTKSPCQC